MSGLSAAADLLVLNLLAILCSLPIFTIGAAVTALDDVCFRMIRQEGSSVVRGYFHAFRANFKRGILLGLLFLAAAALLYFDYLAALAYAPVFRVGIAAIAFLCLAFFSYAFFPRTLLMLMFTVGFWLACITFIRLMAPVLFLFGISLPCYVSCMLLGEVFRKLEEKNEENETQS